MSDIERKVFKGEYCSFECSYDGKAHLHVNLSRVKRNGEKEWSYLDITLNRSDVCCVIRAMSKFLLAEQEQVNQMIAYMKGAI